MLTKPMRKYVESKTKVGYDKHMQDVYDDRLWKYATEALKDLKLLAEKLPEEQLEKIFSVENTQPFLGALLALKSDNEEKRRERIIELWDAIFKSVLSAEYGMKLVNRDVWRALTLREDRTLEAIYYATRFHDTK
jgi:hypothetical protein